MWEDVKETLIFISPLFAFIGAIFIVLWTAYKDDGGGF